ncbi:MAG: Holliday junction resolvase RuvX [Anaerovoracaceae bacterium]|nr:Holliday junction resolvase RuvX [Bacillota bacterium]MDD7734245.1 Holliday junction resolvase RuvX [Bacillota bacterium]MDY5906512.1 Holliday junction resolvase RuvX [Anaerovoracaceae bacterium]
MKAISLDVGDKTIGVALSDALMLTAQGLMTIERIGIRKDADKVLALVKEHGCDTIVMGLPLNLDGSDSIQTEKVRAFRTMLENKMKSNAIKGVEIVYQDERFTTKIAESVLIEADVSRKKRKDVIDKQAAVIILQSWLDRQAFLRKAEEEKAATEAEADDGEEE